MVIVNLKGGLGNQLFEYASAMAIAKHRKQELVFDVQSFDNDPYNRKFALTPIKINNSCYSKGEISSFLSLSIIERTINYFKTRTNKHYYSLGDLDIDLQLLEVRPKHQYLNGYFAHPFYFEGIRTDLLKYICLKENYQTRLYKQKLAWIKENNFISVHIRRSDYISDKGASDLFETLDREYYDRAINYFRSNVVCSQKFLLFSDDIDWVKKEFENLDQVYFIDEIDLYKDYYDLMLMAACDHNIIANSTFSWWGAWLNQNLEKVVVAPKKWYKNPSYQAFYQKSHFVPKTWKLL